MTCFVASQFNAEDTIYNASARNTFQQLTVVNRSGPTQLVKYQNNYDDDQNSMCRPRGVKLAKYWDDLSSGIWGTTPCTDKGRVWVGRKGIALGLESDSCFKLILLIYCRMIFGYEKAEFKGSIEKN